MKATGSCSYKRNDTLKQCFGKSFMRSVERELRGKKLEMNLGTDSECMYEVVI